MRLRNFLVGYILAKCPINYNYNRIRLSFPDSDLELAKKMVDEFGGFIARNNTGFWTYTLKTREGLEKLEGAIKPLLEGLPPLEELFKYVQHALSRPLQGDLTGRSRRHAFGRTLCLPQRSVVESDEGESSPVDLLQYS